MPWNWELSSWPEFAYNPKGIFPLEKEFLLKAGQELAFMEGLDKKDSDQFRVEILTEEGLESSAIEGEILDRESLQSSIKKQFGIKENYRKQGDKEHRMAQLTLDMYQTFSEPLSHEMLWRWHKILFDGQTHITDRGSYRTHPEPMQIISNHYDNPHVFFEAPPSNRVLQEMGAFIQWFNDSKNMMPVLGRVSLAHLYFENIHPFEDGNGRIGRILVEKALSEGIDRPVLLAVSKILEKEKKEYYRQLEKCNRSLDADEWVLFFSEVVLQAQIQSLELLHFLLAKSKMMLHLSGKINDRQEKVLLRIFREGPAGFSGGLSAENYRAIAKTTRPTATRDLADLVEKGGLRKTGELRYTRYWLNLEDFP